MDIEFKRKAVKYIESCDYESKKRLKEAISKLPFGDVKKLRGYNEEYRLRVGNLRVIFSKSGNKIIINDIKPRGQVYKRL